MSDLLFRFADRPLGTVVVVGAGPDPSMWFSAGPAQPAQRVLLIEGDAESAAVIERAIARGLRAELWPVVVMPQRCETAWYRYSLPALNGPLDMSMLRSHYPRLAVSERRQVSALALADVLAPLELGNGHTTAHVLVLDVPGQEATLLRALPLPVRESFDLIVLRGCAGGFADRNGEAVQDLLSAGWERVHDDAYSEPLWPVTVLRFDAARQHLAQLHQQLESLRADVRQRDDTLASMRLALEQSENAVAEKRGKLKSRDQRLGEADERAAALTRERDDARARERTSEDALRQVQQALDQSRAAHESSARLLAERDAQVDALWLEKREVQEVLQEQQELAEQLQLTLRSAQAELDALHIELAQERDRLQRLEHAAGDERSTAGLQIAESHTRIDQMQARLQSSATEQSHLARRQQLLQEELLRAEGQLDLIRSLLLTDAGL